MRGSGISWAVFKSAPCSKQTTTPAPHHSVFYRPDALPAIQSTASKLLLLKSAEFDDDVALLLSVAGLVMGPHVTSESEIGSTDSAALRTSRACLRLSGSCVTSCTSFFRDSDPAIYEAPETTITDSSPFSIYLKYSKTKLPWFSCLLQHSARKRGGLQFADLLWRHYVQNSKCLAISCPSFSAPA